MILGSRILYLKIMQTIDASKVPFKTLYTGDKIPVIGLGTFGSDNYDAETIAQAVKTAIKMGGTVILTVPQFMVTKKKSVLL